MFCASCQCPWGKLLHSGFEKKLIPNVRNRFQKSEHALKVSSDTIIGWGATLILNCPKWNFSEHPRAQWYMSKQFWRQINLQYNQGRFSNVYKCSGLQALFVVVFYKSVDLLCKNSYKSSSLLGYFDCFQSNHTVGCCNINFRRLSN